WASLVVNEKVTVWNSVPAFMGLLLDHANGYPEAVGDSLRLVLLSGDWIPVTMPERIRELVRHAQIISLGGATEASIWSILYPIDKVDPAWRSIPYGRPMRNQSFHVLNSALEPCPDWVTGQLYIGGIGLAKGYWRDTDKTRERFIVHPRNGERLYRTGDLGRYLPDSNIEFLGREDFQVKVHGNRVELGEIEAALVQHPSIAAAVVNAQGELRGPKRLVAYVVPKKRGEKSEPSDVSAAFNSLGPAPTAVGSSEAWTPDLLLLPARNEWGEDREEGKRKKDGPPLPSPLLSSQGRAGEFHACLPEIGGKYFRQFHDELDGVAANFARLERLSTAYIVRALRDLGALTERKSKHSLETTLSRFHIQPRHRKLVSQWLAALESEGLIERDGPGLYTCRSPRDSDEVGPLLDEARRQQTDWDKPMLDYLERSGENLLGLLTGNVDPLELLFPGGSWERAEAFYQENALARCFNQLLGELLGAAVQSWPAGQPLRILEIGAGTGSATSSVLPVLPADRTAYAYTDRSVFFLKGAKKKFSSYPFLTYQLLNIEEDPVAQGFATNSHDVIMATNVLHGTRSISEALQHVRSLLAPGGFVWLFEATRNLRFHLATVGFIEGFGRFEDHRKGRSGPLLSAAEWEESLRAAGFESVSAFPQPDSPANVLGHHVIVAQAAVVTSKNSISSVGRSDLQRIVPSAPGSIPAAAELSPVATTALLPLSARDEWGEDRGEGNAHKDGPPLSGPSQGREGEIQAPPIDESELRRFLRSKLPEYMVPAVFVPLEELPLSANGKVDRRLLPLPEVGSRPGQQNFVEARNAVEKVLAKVWADVFGLDRVGVHDNFFDLGGDSILNIQIVSRALGAGIQIDPRQTFQFQTIAELAEFARTAESLTQTSSRRSES
ncbi:MAG: AMP-binding protein, partial [Verrucomicrobia bacterium]|nr:AMP-binding protein [Verrucomicrobiota bacterium]